MKLLQGASFLFLSLIRPGRAIINNRQLSISDNATNATNATDLDQNGVNGASDVDSCFNLILSGDAETGMLSDWDAVESGSIAFDTDVPFGSTR